MGRDELADHHGMLFLYNQADLRTFWMKNTPVDLDIIFLDRAGHIGSIVRNAKANSPDPIPSEIPAKAVLELKAGSAANQSLRIGDKARHWTFGTCSPYSLLCLPNRDRVSRS